MKLLSITDFLMILYIYYSFYKRTLKLHIFLNIFFIIFSFVKK